MLFLELCLVLVNLSLSVVDVISFFFPYVTLHTFFHLLFSFSVLFRRSLFQLFFLAEKTNKYKYM